MNKIILSDLGHVIIKLRIQNTIERINSFLKKPISADSFNNIIKNNFFVDFELGNISFEKFHELFCQKLNISLPLKSFKLAWNECLVNVVPGLDEVFLILKKHVTFYALSNTNEVHLEYMIKTFPIMKSFKKIYTSHHLHLRKPDPLIFKNVLKDLNFKNPKNILFLDDTIENVTVARNYGFSSEVCYESAKDFKTICEKFIAL